MKPSSANPATEMAAAIRRGEVRSVGVTTAILDRIAASDGPIRSLAYVDRAGAVRHAEAADRAVAAGGPLGPLHGVPMTLKDAFRVAGMRSSFGLPHLKFHRPAADCEVVARLRRAGAVFLGRTAVPFACFDWQCRPPLARECVHPLDPARTPGGSSGGAAAALAAGFTPLELGTDVAGSARYPAHCCGVFALRTTLGLLPAADIGPDGRPLFPSALSVSPMARGADDLGLLLSALLPDPDPREAAGADGRPLRVAVTRSIAAAPPGPGTAAAIDQVVRRAEAAGHRVEVLDAPPFDFDEAFAVWGILGGYEFRQALPWAARSRVAVRAFAAWFLDARLGPGPLTTTLRRGLLASAAEYRDGLTRRDELVAAADRFFDRHDVWVLPVSPGPALLRQRSGRPVTVDGRTTEYSQYLGTYLCPTIPIGTPAVVVPAGTDPTGLPVAVQVHARRFTDRWLVRAADRLLAGPHPG